MGLARSPAIPMHNKHTAIRGCMSHARCQKGGPEGKLFHEFKVYNCIKCFPGTLALVGMLQSKLCHSQI